MKVIEKNTHGVRCGELGLKGPVNSCVEQDDWSNSDANGGCDSESHCISTRYDFNFKEQLVAKRVNNPDGSEWEVRYLYDSRGLLIKTISGRKGDAAIGITNIYGQSGKIERTTTSDPPSVGRH